MALCYAVLYGTVLCGAVWHCAMRCCMALCYAVLYGTVLCTYCAMRYIGLISKIESCESIARLEEIIAVSDGAMVARGDLGAQIPLEEVPSVQQDIVQICRDLNKPVIVASQLLESMIEFPTPTRAEVRG
ncbi:unnamed protein product [Closterium sp. NIES-53]